MAEKILEIHYGPDGVKTTTYIDSKTGKTRREVEYPDTQTVTLSSDTEAPLVNVRYVTEPALEPVRRYAAVFITGTPSCIEVRVRAEDGTEYGANFCVKGPYRETVARNIAIAMRKTFHHYQLDCYPGDATIIQTVKAKWPRKPRFVDRLRRLLRRKQ